VVRRVGGVDVFFQPTLVHYRYTPVTRGVWSFARRRVAAFDVVHIFGLYDPQGPVVSFACRRRGVPYVVEPIGMFKPIVRSRTKKKLFHAVLGGPELAGAARVVATSETEREELEQGGVAAASIVVRRNGIDLAPFASLPEQGRFRDRFGVAPDELVTLFLGRVAVKKHPELLLRAFAQVASPRGRLVFVGPDEDGLTARLHDQARALGMSPEEVIFAGPDFDEKRKVEALTDADVFVLPSESENFGNAAAEAMACGTPVIVTDRCGVAEYVGETAGIVVPLDAEALSRALDSVLHDSVLRERLATGATTVARGLSWDEPLDKTESMYREIVG
jgi:glycosyltransferase involved in cell wall biosynthesis